ncbi:MAG: NAD(P)/FAD-dependent oxidoreductase [Christensenellales bacterium]
MVYDSIIIGSGVAGLTSALYLARAQKSVLILEDSLLGGTTATLEKIENYPGFQSISGMNLIQNMVMQVSNLGVNIDFMHIKSIDFDNKTIICDNVSFEYKTLIIASGTSYNKLNLPEEDSFKFKGLSYCAVCDGNLYKNKTIVVVTNGFTGANSINYLSNLTDNLIIIDLSSTYSNEKFTVYNNSIVTKLLGNNYIEGIEIKSNDVLITLDCDAVFVSLGKKSDLSLYEKYIKCEDMHILSDENMHTNIDGVFVAGDIRKKSLRQIVTACSDGAIAGNEAIKFLQK